MPVRIIFGAGCLSEHRAALTALGKRAFIVTGKSSGRASGALDDVLAALREAGAEHMLFDKVENNPGLDNVADGGAQAREFGADLVIGIGGGSPLDAAKAIAVLAANPMDPVRLYENSFASEPLPMALIPTTSGTGSEVTQYSILTRPDLQTKMSFGNDSTFAKVAFLDPNYTSGLPAEVTVDTAADAYSHALEGYISKRATPVSDTLALQAMENFSLCRDALLEGNFSFAVREKLMYASMLAGIVIAQTGTTALHAMGYALTYFLGFPHGRANGYLMRSYLKAMYPAAQVKIDRALSVAGFRDPDDLGEYMLEAITLEGTDFAQISTRAEEFADLALKQRSVKNSPAEPDRAGLTEILKNAQRRDNKRG